MPIEVKKPSIGKKANVTELITDGTIRRRMLDLDIIDGTEIEPLYKSLSGNPVAYLNRVGGYSNNN